MHTQARTFYFLVLTLFLLFTLPTLLSDGMFMDGLLYAAIANNMAHGWGSFWSMHLSDGMFTVFYEHPPLQMGLQALCFKLFGDSILVERFYSLTTFALTAYFLVLIWKTITGKAQLGWLPIFFWTVVSIVSWSYANNMLENTMTVFIVLAAWLLVLSIKNNRLWLFVLAGLSLALAVLTKGFVSLYIWAMPFFIWWVLRKVTFIQMAVQSILLVISTLIPLLALYGLNPEAAESMSCYFNKQVVGSIEKVVTVDSRFQILWYFVQHSVAPLVVAAIIVLLNRKYWFAEVKKNFRPALLFFLMVLSGILPIMISLKQRGFYITSVYPFLGLSLALLVQSLVEHMLIKISTQWQKILKIVSYIMFGAVLAIAVLQINRIGRDKTLISDTHKIIEAVGEDALIGICINVRKHFSLHGYLARHSHVGLDHQQPGKHPYFLLQGKACKQFDTTQYQQMNVDLELYELYRKEEPN